MEKKRKKEISQQLFSKVVLQLTKWFFQLPLTFAPYTLYNIYKIHTKRIPRSPEPKKKTQDRDKIVSKNPVSRDLPRHRGIAERRIVGTRGPRNVQRCGTCRHVSLATVKARFTPSPPPVHVSKWATLWIILTLARSTPSTNPQRGDGPRRGNGVSAIYIL